MTTILQKHRQYLEYIKANYEGENQIRSVVEFNRVFNTINNPEVIRGNSIILFSGMSLDSIQSKNLDKVFGEREYLLLPESGISDHKVHFYEFSSIHLSFSIQFHFSNDELFFISSRVYSFVPLLDKDKQLIIESLTKKNCDGYSSGKNEIAIIDTAGNLVYVTDGVNFRVNYIPNTSATQELKNRYINYVKDDKQKELKEIINHLF